MPPDNNNAVEERLKRIEEKINSIEDKLTEKWVLPVAITVLTAVLGLMHFLIERNVSKADISQNKQREIIGEFIAKNKVDFYQKCRGHLNDVADQFESYCKVGRSAAVEAQLDSSLIVFRKFVMEQQVIDQRVIEPVKKYTEFVSESVFDMSSKEPSSQQVMQIYEESKSLLEEANAALQKGIHELSGL